MIRRDLNLELTPARREAIQDFMFLLTSPIIYAQIVPSFILDLFVTFYQNVCFPLYGIERVNRSEYIVMDRHKLSYLNWRGKIHCMYCAYFNGVIGYVLEVAARTEKRWCPSKHLKKRAHEHAYYKDFAEYGDEVGYRKIRPED